MYKGIEGARGWLAWTVVFGHLAITTPLSRLPLSRWPGDMAGWAVAVFIVVSGFVITHLLVNKQERYGVYILRRALRIYPAYLIGLVLGAALAGQAHDLLNALPVAPELLARMEAQQQAWRADPPAYMLLHLTLLHGMVPNDLLAESQYLPLPPAWSLSLEWQFYLVAPLLLLGLRRHPAVTVGLSLVLLAAFQRGVFGSFHVPSLIFGVAWYFLLGMLTFLHLDRLPRFARYPWTILLLALSTVSISREFLPFVAWLAIVLYLRSDSLWPALDGRFFRYLGAGPIRSISSTIRS